jgi:hypothetical protein
MQFAADRFQHHFLQSSPAPTRSADTTWSLPAPRSSPPPRSSGQITCSRERSNHVLPTLEQYGIDTRRALALASVRATSRIIWIVTSRSDSHASSDFSMWSAARTADRRLPCEMFQRVRRIVKRLGPIVSIRSSTRVAESVRIGLRHEWASGIDHGHAALFIHIAANYLARTFPSQQVALAFAKDGACLKPSVGPD